MIKKNLRHLHAVVTKQTYWRLMHWAEAVGLPEKEIGRIIDRLVREKALWYRKEGQEWHDLYEEQEVYRIVKWQPLPEV